MHIRCIPNMHTSRTLLVLLRLSSCRLYRQPSGLLHWYFAIAPVPVKQPSLVYNEDPYTKKTVSPWRRYPMERFFASLALCVGNPPVTGEFPSQMPVTQSFDVFFDLHLNKRLSKQSRRRWFKTPLRSLWRHCNALVNRGPGRYGWFSHTNHIKTKDVTTPKQRTTKLSDHGDVMTWKHFSRYWSRHKGSITQSFEVFLFFFVTYAKTDSWANSGVANDWDAMMFMWRHFLHNYHGVYQPLLSNNHDRCKLL